MTIHQQGFERYMKKILLTVFIIAMISLIILQTYTGTNKTDSILPKIEIKKKIQSPEIIPTILIKNIKIMFEENQSINKTSVFSNNSKLKYSNKIDSEWVKVRGEWMVKNNKYIQSDTKSWALSFLSPIEYHNLTNYITEANVLMASGKNIVYKFRYQGSQRFLQINFYGTIYIQCVHGASSHTLANFDFPSGFKYEEPHNLKVIVNNNHIMFYLDGVLLWEGDDEENHNPKGTIALGTDRTAAEFSDILIQQLTNQTINFTLSYRINTVGISNLSTTIFLSEIRLNPSGIPTRTNVYHFSQFNYTSNTSTFTLNDTLSFPIDLIRPPDIIYFPTEDYNRTFAIRLIAKGWDEQQQKWVFAEAMSPEFTWEDVVEGRTITAGGNSTG